MNSKNYESWKLEGMPYCYGQSFEIEYNDLDSWRWRVNGSKTNAST